MFIWLSCRQWSWSTMKWRNPIWSIHQLAWSCRHLCAHHKNLFVFDIHAFICKFKISQYKGLRSFKRDNRNNDRYQKIDITILAIFIHEREKIVHFLIFEKSFNIDLVYIYFFQRTKGSYALLLFLWYRNFSTS